MLLYVDEAHAVGVCGHGGLGLCYSHPDFEDIDIVIGTMGKALASTGAYCICSERMRQFAVNRCRSLIFSTALPPVSCAWSRFVIDKVIGMDTERQHLGRISAAVSAAAGLNEPSHIVPVIAGSSAKAMEWSAKLADRGLKVLPIRTPTVPPGTERLRISLSANVSDQSVTNLIQALGSLR
ncbi:MAG: aminotransferase class I/II-fold pyridoxal phosphate-dependent enzyme [Paramuribaculum sp.]|nr:aminotransferase class I/II-fold pyridoxal phosphate-dependent enzyme [Paramuribaculum sp.]